MFYPSGYSPPLTPKPNIQHQCHEPAVCDVPSSLASPHPSLCLTSAVELVLSISPVPHPGRCPVTKRISHGGGRGGARIRIHSFEAHHTNFGENGWQEPWSGTTEQVQVIGNHRKYL